MTQFTKYVLFALFAPLLAVAEDPEIREISDFNRIEVDGNIDIEISQAEEFEVVVFSAEGDLENLRTRLTGRNSKTLVVDLDDTDKEGYSAVVSMPMLSSLKLEGAGEATIDDFDVDDLELSVAGSGAINAGELVATEVELGIAGSGDIGLDALDAESLEVQIAGSGDIYISQLQVDDMSAEIAGSGDISASGSATTLSINIEGSGNFSGEDFGVETLEGVIAGSGDVDIGSVAHNYLNSVDAESEGYRDDRKIDRRDAPSENHGSGTFVFGEWLIGLVAVVLSLGMPIIIVALLVTYSYRKKRLQHETLRQLAESDQPIPEHIMATLAPEQSSSNGMRTGIVLIALGLGIAVFLIAMGAEDVAAIGCIPGFVGLAQLAIWKLENKGSK